MGGISNPKNDNFLKNSYVPFFVFWVFAWTEFRVCGIMLPDAESACKFKLDLFNNLIGS